MADNTSTFLDDIVQELGDKLTPEQKAAIDQLKANPEFSQKVNEGALRQSDFSRQSNELRTKLGQVQQYYNDLKKAEDDLRARGANVGQDPNAGDPPQNQPNPNNGVQPDTLKKADLDSRVEELQNQTASVIIKTQTLSFDYFKRFGEPLDAEALFDSAVKAGISLDEAYRQMIEPKVNEQREADIQKRIEDAKSEAVNELLAKHNFPAGTFQNAKPGPVDVLNTEDDQRPATGWKAAVEAYQNAQK